MGVKIQLLRSTASEWTAKNPTLDAGQPGFEIDTYKLKIGNGVLAWNDLPYITGGFGGNDGPLEYEYDVTMGSDGNIPTSEVYFSSLCNNIDFSSYFDDLINNQYTVNLKLTSVNDSNKFLIASCDNITKNSQFGDIDAFWPSRSIKWIIDGGDDQYDSANYINTNYTYSGIPTGSPSSTTLRNISIPYNGGRIAEQSQYWGSNDYVTLYKKSIWAMVAKGNTSTMPNTVFYGGNTGADGDGDKNNGTLTNYNGYQAGYARLYGDDPTYTKLIITKTGTTPSYFIDSDNDTNDDLFGASGISSDTIAVVVFYGSDNVNPSSLSDLQTLFENFVDNVLSGSDVSQIKNDFYTNFSTLYGSVDPGFWYEDFEFFTGTNNGSANIINSQGGSGSGAVFEITVDQETNKYIIATSVVGINYVVGDIVKIPGSDLEGPDGISPDEDIYVQVDTIDINGGIDTFSTIISNEYRFINLTRLAESDGFRFIDNEKFYLNIDVAGLSLDIIDTQIQDTLNTTLIAGDGIDLDYVDPNLTISVENNYINTKLLAGDNVIFSYDNIDDELTISANSITVPNLQDILVEGDGIDIAYDEEANTVTISQESINNYTDNRLLTSDGTTTGIDAESNLTFDGSTLDINGDILGGTTSLPANFIISARDDQAMTIRAGSSGASINLDSVTDSNIDLLTTGIGKVNISNAFNLPNIDGAADSFLITDGAGNTSWSSALLGDLDGAVIYQCKNNTGSTINKGVPVYISGHFANGKVYVEPARSDDSSKMPAFGLLGDTLDPGDEGHVHIFGALSNIDTQTPGYTIGQTLYIAPTGGLTSTRPTSETHLIQNIGRVARVHNSNGRIVILGPGRTNDVPNSISAYKLDIDNIRIDGNTISSTNSNGNIIVSPNGKGNIQNFDSNLLYKVYATTTNTSSTVLTLDGGSPTGSNTLVVPAQTSWIFNVSISAYNSSAGAAWNFRGAIRRDNSNNISIVGSTIEENWLDSGLSSATASISADSTNKALQISVVGISGTVKWNSIVNITQITN